MAQRKVSYEDKLWQIANALRGSMDTAEYKHVVLGLIFLKYISDISDEQSSSNVVLVPPEAHWDTLKREAKQGKIGEALNNAMEAIERYNESLKGILPKGYTVNEECLCRLIEILSEAKEESRDKDILGRVYEYFLSQFARASSGEFYTPRCVVKLLVEMLQPYRGYVYDPCCGSGGMFTYAHNAGKSISIYGQELNHITWRLAKMNLVIRGIEGHIAQGDTLHNDQFPDLKADYILANPPFNVRDWGGDRLRNDKRWKYGIPPLGNANFAWVQHIIHHLAPNGIAGVVLANGSMSSNQCGEGEIRKNIIEDDLVDCMVALPTKLFHSTQISTCLWLLALNKENSRRRNRVLFIDARNMGRMVDRIHRELTEDDILRISNTYHSWREGKEYNDVAGFCKSATLDDIRKHNYVLTPGRYVGSAPQQEDSEPFEERMQRLVAQLRDQQAETARLDEAIWKNLADLGFSA